jgi:hypothetical protein
MKRLRTAHHPCISCFGLGQQHMLQLLHEAGMPCTAVTAGILPGSGCIGHHNLQTAAYCTPPPPCTICPPAELCLHPSRATSHDCSIRNNKTWARIAADRCQPFCAACLGRRHVACAPTCWRHLQLNLHIQVSIMWAATASFLVLRCCAAAAAAAAATAACGPRPTGVCAQAWIMSRRTRLGYTWSHLRG